MDDSPAEDIAKIHSDRRNGPTDMADSVMMLAPGRAGLAAGPEICKGVDHSPSV